MRFEAQGWSVLTRFRLSAVTVDSHVARRPGTVTSATGILAADCCLPVWWCNGYSIYGSFVTVICDSFLGDAPSPNTLPTHISGVGLGPGSCATVDGRAGVRHPVDVVRGA